MQTHNGAAKYFSDDLEYLPPGDVLTSQPESLTIKQVPESYRQTVEEAAVGIAHVTLQGNILQANQKFCDLLGREHKKVLQHSFVELLSANDQHLYQQNIQQLQQGTAKSFSYDIQNLNPQFPLKWVNLAISLGHQLSTGTVYVIIVLVDVSKRKQLESKLRDSEEQMRVIFESIRDLVFICTVSHGQIEDINIVPTYPEENNFSTVIDATLQYLWSDDADKHGDTLPKNRLQQAITSGETCNLEYSLCLNHDQLWFMANVSPITNNTVLIVARDISDRKQAELELFAEKELAQVTLNSIGDGVVTTDIEGHITNLNPVAEKITGWKSSEAQGKDIREIFQIIHETTRQSVPNPIHQAISTGQTVNIADQTLLITRDGYEYVIEDSAAPIRNRQGQVVGAIMVFHDTTNSRKLAHQLSWQATHDPLTQLINRHQFESILFSSCPIDSPKAWQHILCFLDLDHLQIVNNTCGRAAGDELLYQSSQLFQGNIRANDTLARLGGDQFAILLHQCPLEQGLIIAQNICDRMHEYRFHWEDKVFSVGVSIGLVKLDQDYPSVDEALRVADTACNIAKEKGRNRIQFYDIHDSALLKRQGQQKWSVQIAQALEHKRLCLFAQTIAPTDMDTSQSKQHVCEILLRMLSPDGTVITAGSFIPAAERFNLITQLDRWVIQQFLQEYKALTLRHDDSQHSLPTRYMINLSGASIGDEKFLQFLKQQLLDAPQAAEQICFEITETVAIANLEHATHFIQELKQLGCQFALDDFGSGMSSFGYLKVLPVDYLKIDGSFIQEMTNDTASSAIVEAINNVGHIMGMKTIAEYVQNASIRRQLKDLGVDYVQGFGISKPKALADCIASNRILLS